MKNKLRSQLSLSSLKRKAALGSKFSYLGIQQSVGIADDIVQVIWIKQTMLEFHCVNIQNRHLVWLNNSYTYLEKCGSVF